MNKLQKIDLFRFIGEELYMKYREKVISIFPAYDTGVVQEDTDISELTHSTFIKPYLAAIENGEDKMEELQYILAIIKRTIFEYDKVKQRDKELEKKAYSMTVRKALDGDKGASY